ncbi:perlucin-like protein [Ostrea edulis]|uniref:perlucin-like protein n=1 Tax=Ostrea edulis TaxID=37623 RepID=UPI0024AFEC1A|nr:perlucin-like protein [Ostrea edulis]
MNENIYTEIPTEDNTQVASIVTSDQIYSEITTSQDNVQIPLPVMNDHIYSDLKTEYNTNASKHTDTAAGKENIRRNYVIALIVVLIIIICVLSSILIVQNLEQENGETACEGGWYQFGDTCYQFSNSSVTFDDAVKMCIGVSSGAILLEIRSLEEEIWIRFMMKLQGLTTTWMGITDSLDEGTFVFVSSDKKIQNVYAHWDRGQPEGGKSENCGLLLLGYEAWHDFPCSFKYEYICAKARLCRN